LEQLTIQNIPLNDEKTWELFQKGQTRGIFQCESRLVQHWLKKIQPKNLWELSAVIAIVRPGALESGFAETYVENGNKPLEEVESFGHPMVDEILEPTRNVILYQESLITLARRLAFLHLPDKEAKLKADLLRKAVGKKDQSKILLIGKEFVDGCLHNGVTEEIANKLFEVIKNCGRYLFNLSHSFQYATVAYFTAYLKVHNPLQFYAVYLSYAKHRQSIRYGGKEIASKWIETKDFVNDARKFGVDTLSPNINKKNIHFKIEGDKMRFGLTSIKYCSGLATKLDQYPEIKNWQQFLLLCTTKYYGFKVNASAVECLVKTGSFIDTNLSRSVLYNLILFTDVLSVKESEALQAWLVKNKDIMVSVAEFPKIIEEVVIPEAMAKRVPILQEHLKLLPGDLAIKDHPAAIEEWESAYLGIALSASSLDGKDHASNTCDECVAENCPLWARKTVNVKLDSIRFTTTKNGANPGQNMAIIDVSDYTGSLSLAVFPEQFALYEDVLMEKNMVAISLVNGKRGFVVNEITQL
jgi:DNA polymerase III alpha subunit